MKKWFAFLLALIMCQSLCACGGTANQKDNMEEIATALNAIWMDEAPIPDTSYTVVMSYVFNEDGSVIGGVDISTGPGKNLRTTSASGTYEITDEKIIIDWTEIDNQIKDFPLIPDSEHPYLYEDNTLRLFSGDGKAELIRQELE